MKILERKCLPDILVNWEVVTFYHLYLIFADSAMTLKMPYFLWCGTFVNVSNKLVYLLFYMDRGDNHNSLTELQMYASISKASCCLYPCLSRLILSTL